jgi:thiopeptide-type bacteriocin biosynthesis protein
MKDYIQKFAPGSKWLYIRIYGGPHALEEWMTGPFRKLLSEWKDSGLVVQFHFVRYLDPEYHLRLRFLLSDPVHSGILLNQLQGSCNEMLEEDLVWKIEVGTYEPEHERYGAVRMSCVESWFEIDSLYWLDEIDRCGLNDDTGIWKSAMRSIDVFLEDFGANIDDKINIINQLKESAAYVFVLNKSMRGQLDDKYRKMSGELDQLIDTDVAGTDYYLVQRSADAGKIIRQLQESFSDQAALFESNLVPDLIHMSLNRAFRTRHRLQEMVLYDFQSRYYESGRAKAKNMKRGPEEVTSDK